MERRSWPWKKKSSEKTASASPAASLSNIGVKQEQEKEQTKPISFAQISIEKYEYLNGLEEEVELLREHLSFTKEKLCSSQAETKTKDELVKQHAKFAEEAISGWEKVEAEALALRHQLESVTLLKLSAEERAAHLDGALKECMKQVHNVKEEGEQRLHDILFAKTKQWEKVKAELESTISSFEQELMKCSGETALLSRTLQERSMSLMKIGEDKARADAEIEVLKTNIQSYEREVISLKYELNIAAKELEIRNEEKNMSVRSAEAANKQHMEDVKKITKLEAECQRLRGLVRKKLPGPAALAQMKLEVENLNQDLGDSNKLRRQSGKNSSSYPVLASEAMVNELEQYHKEHEFLASRMLAMEEETKMLKEALSKRNTELRISRSTCAKVASKLRTLETQMLTTNHQKSSSKSNAGISLEGSLSQNESNQSITSMSEYGIDDRGSCVESWATALVSELSQIKKEKISDRTQITHSNQLELMDDFLEMERLASFPSDDNGVVAGSNEWEEKMKANCNDTSSVDVHIDVCKEQVPGSIDLQTDNQRSGNLPSKIKTQIASVVESKVPDDKMGKPLEEIMAIVGEVPESEAALSQGGNLRRQIENTINQEMRNAISWIHDFVLSFYKEVSQVKSFEGKAAREKVEEFSDSITKLISSNLNLDGFVVSLFHVLAEIVELRSKPWDMGENNSVACVDKVTLLENGISLHDPIEGNFSGFNGLLPPSSNPDIVRGPTNASADLKDTSQSSPMEEFEHVKLERDNLEVNLARCRETLESTKLELTETEQHLTELKLQLSASRKSTDFAETQLRCMTESYKCLESRAHQLESEISLLRSKTEALETELNAERLDHQEDISKYNELQEQMRNMHCLKCSSHSHADADSKEREIAAAAEKLAACQETIILLNKQLTALCPTVEPVSMSSCFREEPKRASFNSQLSQFPTFEDGAIEISPSVELESPTHEYGSQVSTSDMESSPTPKQSANSKRPKHRSRSSSASSLSSILNEKQGRSFSRFFVKGKTDT